MSDGNLYVLKGLLQSRCLTLNPWPKVSDCICRTGPSLTSALKPQFSQFVDTTVLCFVSRWYNSKLWHYAVFHLWAITMVFFVDPLHNNNQRRMPCVLDPNQKLQRIYIPVAAMTHRCLCFSVLCASHLLLTVSTCSTSNSSTATQEPVIPDCSARPCCNDLQSVNVSDMNKTNSPTAGAKMILSHF